MKPPSDGPLSIKPLTEEVNRERCALLMSTSEPWVTIGRTYEGALAILRDPVRENWIAFRGDAFAGFLILVLKGEFKGYIQTVCVASSMQYQRRPAPVTSYCHCSIGVPFTIRLARLPRSG